MKIRHVVRSDGAIQTRSTALCRLDQTVVECEDNRSRPIAQVELVEDAGISTFSRRSLDGGCVC
jgi:hypothetical protein